jgi:putative sugar O-methyltransferase
MSSRVEFVESSAYAAACRAAKRGDLKSLQQLHRKGLRLQSPGNELFCKACESGHIGVVKYLHQNGLNLAEPDNEPLCRACASGELEVVRYIHQNGGDIRARNDEPLRRAAAGRHSMVVQYLHDSGAATSQLSAEARHMIDQMKQELRSAQPVYHPSAFWTQIGEVNERVLGWSGEAHFKRTLNQNYFNFIPGSDDARMVRMRRLTRQLDRAAPWTTPVRRWVRQFNGGALGHYSIDDPDCDPASWLSCYPGYFIFKEPDRATKRELYREYLALMFEYALHRDQSGLLETLEEPELGNPIRVHRGRKLISQDLVNSVRERNTVVAAMNAESDSRFRLAELGAGYGRLGYVMMRTTECRYYVFDIPPALYLSQWYLTTLFPERRAFRFRRFEAFDEIERELSQADIAFFTPNQLAKFPAGYFDAFATISSIHEMRRDQIQQFMKLMGHTARQMIYLKQWKDYVNPYDGLVIGRNDYPVPVGWSVEGERFDLINPGFFERIYRRDLISS